MNPYGPDVGIEAGQRYRRAPAAVIVARALGFDTPGTVLAEWHGDHGSLQEWRPDLAPDQPSTAADLDRFNNSQTRKDLDALDFVMGRAPRRRAPGPCARPRARRWRRRRATGRRSPGGPSRR